MILINLLNLEQIVSKPKDRLCIFMCYLMTSCRIYCTQRLSPSALATMVANGGPPWYHHATIIEFGHYGTIVGLYNHGRHHSVTLSILWIFLVFTHPVIGWWWCRWTWQPNYLCIYLDKGKYVSFIIICFWSARFPWQGNCCIFAQKQKK